MPPTPAEVQAQVGATAAPIVDVIDAPGGGHWALGADGGVFALGGAPFFGSAPGLYPGLPESVNSQFTRIERHPSGGYQLVSKTGAIFGQVGEFGPPAGQVVPIPPAPPPPPSPPADPGLSPEDQSARGVLNKILDDAGLSQLGGWLWNRYLEVGEGQALLDLRERPEYHQRFPAMKALRDKGRAISENEYIAYERNATQMFRQHGLPEGFFDQPDDFSQFLGGEVSLSELGERIQMASQATFRMPVEDRVALNRLYGVTPGQMTAFFLDPDRAQPVIERAVLAAQIGGAGERTGFGMVTREEAERLADLGLTPGQAQQGFGQLAGAQPLFEALPGTAEGDITRETQLAAQFGGSAAAQEEIQRRQRRREATFEGGGGFAAGQGGISGLGS